MTTVPFSDLHAQYLSLKGDLDAAIADVIRTSAFIRGPHVDRFEADFAVAVGAGHCVSCANGTDSLYLAMRALGVGPGDEVIAPAQSWISTTETITQAGGTVVFCDTDRTTYTIDPARIEEKVTPRTVGILPVHLYGQPADMPAIMAIAARRSLWVIEDCAQAHLARCEGKMAGSFGDIASYSFYPGKNLGAMGDAGALTTDDAALARKVTLLARHGGLRKGEHEIEGTNQPPRRPPGGRPFGQAQAPRGVDPPPPADCAPLCRCARQLARPAIAGHRGRARARLSSLRGPACGSRCLGRASAGGRCRIGRELSGRVALSSCLPPPGPRAGGLSERACGAVTHPLATALRRNERRAGRPG